MLQEIISSVTPNNITDLALYKDAMDIFLEYLVQNSDISIDIKNIFDSKKIPLYEEFVNIYLNNIAKVLSNSKHNEKLYIKLKHLYETFDCNIDEIDLSIDIVKLLKEDYIITNKDYKQSKGTTKGIEYIYNIIIKSGIQRDFLDDNTGNFRYFETGNLFEYSVEGTMINELYEQFVKPLTHPVGWAYFYTRVFYLNFIDYFNLVFEYTFVNGNFEVRCMNGDNYSKDNYYTNISHTGEQLVQDNTVEFISTEYIGPEDNKTKLITVYFKSGEKLISNEDPRSLQLINNDTILIDYNNFDGNCGLFLDYNVKVTTTVDDNMNFNWNLSYASTTGKKNVIGAGNVFIGSFTVGEPLVNKDISVTYQSKVGQTNGIYAKLPLSNIYNNEIYWDLTLIPFDNSAFIFDIQTEEEESTVIEEFGEPIYWDNTPYIFDSNYLFFDNESIVKSRIESGEVIDYTPVNIGGINYPSYDGTNINRTYAVGGYSGNTASDEYEWEQKLVIIPNAEVEFTDEFKKELFWDNKKLKFDSFTFDSEYAAEEFKIDYSHNTWDTDILFDFFQIDGEYTGGEFNY